MLDGAGIAPFDQDRVPGFGEVGFTGIGVGVGQQSGGQEEVLTLDQMGADAQHASSHGEAGILVSLNPPTIIGLEFLGPVLADGQGDIENAALEGDTGATGTAQ